MGNIADIVDINDFRVDADYEAWVETEYEKDVADIEEECGKGSISFNVDGQWVSFHEAFSDEVMARKADEHNAVGHEFYVYNCPECDQLVRRLENLMSLIGR